MPTYPVVCWRYLTSDVQIGDREAAGADALERLLDAEVEMRA
jgi:hypothetical protein